MQQVKLIVSLLMTTLLFSCASTSDNNSEERPSWIDNAKITYPDNTYLTAVGESSNRTRAGKNAVANLVEIFSVDVQSETKVLTEATKKESALGVSSESSTNLQRDIQTKTDQAIQGIEIKETWLSPEGDYYALAVLGKRSASQNLTEGILEMDEQSQNFIKYSNNTAPNSILAINALRSARDLQITRKMSDLQLKYISGAGIPNDTSTYDIENLITHKLAALSFSVEGDNKRETKLLESAVSKLGVQVVEESPLQLSAYLDMGEASYINNWYWLRGSYELTLSENGQVISRKRWPLKVSAKEEALLEPRLQDKLNENVIEYLQLLVSDSPTL